MTTLRRALPTRLQPRPWDRITERASVAAPRDEADKRARPLVAVIVVAAISSLAVLGSVNAKVSMQSLPLAVALVAIGLGAEFLSYNQTKATSGSIAQVPFTAAVMIAPMAATVLVITAAELVVQIVGRRSLLKGTFNLAQIALGLSVGALAYSAVGGVPFATLRNLGFIASAVRLGLATCVLVVTIMTVNSGTVSAAIALTSRKSFVAVWIEHTKATAKFLSLLVLLAFYLTWLSVNLGLIGTVGMAIPLVAVRQLYRTTLELTRVTEELLDLMVAAIEARDPYTSGHSQRVAKASEIIARAIGLSPAQIERVTVAALLHDVGKIDEVFARVLAKEGRLTPEEWDVMKRHPIRSAELVGMLSSLQDVVAPVRHHHENWDGTGYPDGLKAEQIPLASRIIMFADTLDAITTDRPYRKALGLEEARSEFIKFRAKQFDPAICDCVVSEQVWAELYISFGQRESTPRGVMAS